VGEAYGTRGREEKIVQDFGGKTRREEAVRKTEAYMGGWDQNGSYWLGRLAGSVWRGFNWLRIGTSSGLLRTR
jgi:hypothetical protein